MIGSKDGYHPHHYEGPAGSEGALAQDLRTRGATVHYEAPIEQRSVPDAVVYAVTIFTITGPINRHSIIAAARRITNRFRGSRVAGLPDEDDLSAQERLALLDELKSDGTITPEEHARERARILGEL